MKKTISILLTLLMTLALLSTAFAADAAVVEQTLPYPVSLEEGATPDKETTFLRYTPEDFKFRGNSTPVIFVLGATPYTAETAAEAAQAYGFADMVAGESGHVLFVSPVNGESWTEDDFEALRAMAANITDNYTVEKEQEGLYDGGVITEDGDLTPGALYASRTRFYVFAEGEEAGNFVREFLDTPDVVYYNTEWGTIVNGFGAGFHYADSFDRDDNLTAWETLRRVNRIVMMDGVTYLDKYYVYADNGVTESIETFETKEGNTFEYYQYTAETVDLASETEKYPLVLVFHGSNMHPDAYAQLSNWPTMAAEKNLLAISINGNQTDEDIIEFVDWLLETYAIDPSRVYATGYSMGGMKSWSLGFNYTERFAAIVPTEAIPGMGFRDFDYEVPAQKLPTFFIAGEQEFYPMFPMNSEGAIKLIGLLAEANGFAYGAEYDAALDTYFGMAFDNTYVYDVHPENVPENVQWTIHELQSEDGIVYTVLSAISDMGHSTYPTAAEHLWAFMSQFARNEDGSIAYTATE